MVNLTACRYFLEVVHLGSIRLAADRLHVSPSAISRQIAKLEREFGEPLLDRRANGVQLTEAGTLAAEHFASILGQIDLIRGEMSDLRKLKSGSVSIATVDGVTDPYLSEQILAFRKRFPAVDFRMRIRGRERVLEALEKRICQVGFVYDHFSHPMMEIVGQWRQPLLALVPPSHPFADGRAVKLPDIADCDCVLPDDSYGIHHLVHRAFRKFGGKPKAIMVADQLHFLIRHAIRSNAIVYVPLQAALREVEAGELVPLSLACGDFEHRFIYAIVRRDQRRSPACDAFIAMLTSNFPKHEKADAAMLKRLRAAQAEGKA
ncbi:LysR family transcriptional regulator [Stappia indica]|uniref:LysR family transcriptional regulator n=1 Tax=Stappia indica TaxID=538381 RepID=A0A857C9W9_9HYPH|nr:LysR family transcriptional regulator [Stappia indica]QGZ35665.1 LysR family transcriptional regulator [Stappia indica]